MSERFLCQPANYLQQVERDVLADDRGILQQLFLGGGQPIDTRGQHGLHRRRHEDVPNPRGKMKIATLALDHSGIDQRSHDLFDEEWIAASALREKTLQAFQTGVGPQQYVKKFPELLAYERIDT